VETTRRDLFVGLFILVSIGIALGVLIVTSNLLEARTDLYMRAATAEGLTEDTRVALQGLQIGRVVEVNPKVDSTGLVFIARLAIRDAYPDGTQLSLAVGTRAVIEQLTPITAPVIRLESPSTAEGFLAPGDTIESERRRSAIDVLGEVATGLRDELLETLQESRRFMNRSGRAVTTTQEMIETTTPLIQHALEQLNTGLEHADQLMGEITPRIGPLHDSLTATLAMSRSILNRIDTLAISTGDLLDENQDVIRDAVEHLRRSSLILEHFADQVSRRPTRLLTGVQPLVPDTSDQSR
jgi:ABC-type transporter Mla subunit MlaD